MHMLKRDNTLYLWCYVSIIRPLFLINYQRWASLMFFRFVNSFSAKIYLESAYANPLNFQILINTLIANPWKYWKSANPITHSNFVKEVRGIGGMLFYFFFKRGPKISWHCPLSIWSRVESRSKTGSKENFRIEIRWINPDLNWSGLSNIAEPHHFYAGSELI
jgi:hypothetical protein